MTCISLTWPHRPLAALLCTLVFSGVGVASEADPPSPTDACNAYWAAASDPLVSLEQLLDRPEWASLAVQGCRDRTATVEGRAALGFALIGANDPSGVALVAQAADAGHADALFWMAVWAEEGLTIDGRVAAAPDSDRHLRLLRRAANAGQPEAQVLLGRHHQAGRYVLKDLQAARSLYRQAADAGHPDGLFLLGALVSQGLGGPEDIDRGVALIGRAAAMGHPVARWTQATSTLNDEEAEADARARAIADLRALAKEGMPQAVLTLGMAFMEGLARTGDDWIIQPDAAEAKAVFCLAGERGAALFQSLYQEPLLCDAGQNSSEQ